MNDATNPGEATVLVVEDDAALAESLKFALELEGFDARTFGDAESVLAAPSLPERGCLIVDLKLPGLDGLELIRRLRERGVALPAVLMTSNPLPGFRARAAAALTPIVEKPLLCDDLVDTVRELIAATDHS
jgi:FixJ family two-component response regulator